MIPGGAATALLTSLHGAGCSGLGAFSIITLSLELENSIIFKEFFWICPADSMKKAVISAI
jgi:hypothetical protein